MEPKKRTFPMVYHEGSPLLLFEAGREVEQDNKSGG